MAWLKKTYSVKDLTKGCQQGCSQAQEVLYSTYSGQMFALCLRYVGDRMEAEDLMVSGFVKVFAKIGQYSGEGSFEGWMRRLFVNECLMALRKKKQATVSLDSACFGQLGAGNGQLPDSQLNADELMALVQQLPEGYRTVFNLYAIEGYPHQEIAAMLNISEGTSKSQLSKARAALQNMLGTASEKKCPKANCL